MNDAVGELDFDRLLELCERTALLPPAVRRAMLLRESGGDERIVAEVESLLAHDPGPDDHPGTLPAGEGGGAARGGEPADVPGDGSCRIAGFRLHEEIGRGGHGVVHRAVQSAPRREVAIKLLHGAAGSSARRRLHEEGEILGRLRHEGITRVLRTGTAVIERPGGADRTPRAFLVMELVAGVPLAEWVRCADPPIADRIGLLLEVCDAVEDAHRRGVLHRDLKPSNLLVEHCDDGRVRPRVLDFGIARIVDGDDAGGRTRITLDGQVLGTPGYMSPEQIDGDEDDIDTRTDVFALGRVAWACLAGREPIDAGTGPLLARLRRARDEQPPALGRVDPRLAGDLELVVHTAMHPDPARRYGSAAAFRDDLRRVLERRPVAARRPSALYVARRFIARNPGIVALGAAASVGLVAAVGALSWGLDQARERVQEAAERDAASLEAMVAIARELEPIIGAERVRRTALADVVDRLARRIERGEAGRATRLDYAAALEQLASLDEQLGDPWAMLEQSRRALEIRTAVHETDDRATTLEEARAFVVAQVRVGDAHLEIAHRRPDAGGPQHRADAVEHYEAAHAMLERLAKAHPAHVGVLDDLQWSFERLHQAYRVVLPDPVREPRYFAARGAILERILALDPSHPHARRGFVKHLLETERRDPAAGRAVVLEAVRLARDLVAERPNERLAVDRLRQALQRLADMYAAGNAHAEALAAYDEVFEIVLGLHLAAPDDHLHVMNLAGMITNMRRHAAALGTPSAIGQMDAALVRLVSVVDAAIAARAAGPVYERYRDELLVAMIESARALDLVDRVAPTLARIAGHARLDCPDEPDSRSARLEALVQLHELGLVPLARVRAFVESAPGDTAWTSRAAAARERVLGEDAAD